MGFQAGRLPEFEAQEEACHPSPQGCQPFHQGALRVQSEAGFEDRARFGHEEVEGDGQLSNESREMVREMAATVVFGPCRLPQLGSGVKVDEMRDGQGDGRARLAMSFLLCREFEWAVALGLIFRL